MGYDNSKPRDPDEMSADEIREKIDNGHTEFDHEAFEARRKRRMNGADTSGDKPQPQPPSDDEWGDPEPLVEAREREPYPVAALPAGGIREAVQEATDFLQCPPELTASSPLSVLSLAGQGIANVARSKKRLISPVSLYHMAALDSGERKSQTDKMFSESTDLSVR